MCVCLYVCVCFHNLYTIASNAHLILVIVQFCDELLLSVIVCVRCLWGEDGVNSIIYVQTKQRGWKCIHNFYLLCVFF